MFLEQPGDGEGVDRGFQGHLVVWAEALSECPHCRGRGSDSAQLSHVATGQGLRQLGEVLVHVEAKPSHVYTSCGSTG